MTVLKTALICLALLATAIPSVAQAGGPRRGLGFTGHAARSGVVKLYRQRRWSTARLTVNALSLTKNRKTRIFKVTDRATGEARLALQNVRTRQLRLLKLLVPNLPPRAGSSPPPP